MNRTRFPAKRRDPRIAMIKYQPGTKSWRFDPIIFGASVTSSFLCGPGSLITLHTVRTDQCINWAHALSRRTRHHSCRTDWSGGSSNMQKHAKARGGDIRTYPGHWPRRPPGPEGTPNPKPLR